MRSLFTAARFWRATRAKPFLFRLRCPASRHACALLRTSAVTRLLKLKRLSRPRLSALRLPARILACAAGAITSMRPTRRNWASNKRFCARRWNAPEWVRPNEIALLSGEPWGYRNRIRLALDANGNPGYRGRRSHDIVPIAECPIAAPLLVRAALAVGEIMRKLAPGARVNEVSLFCDRDETRLLAGFFSSGAARFSLEKVCGGLAAQIPQLASAELSAGGHDGKPGRTVARWGAESLIYNAAGFGYRVDPGAFFQVNRWLVDEFVDRVTEGQTGSLAWDLFAGVGLFARRLAGRFGRVVAVESSPASTSALNENLSGTTASAVKSTTLDFLRRAQKAQRPDLIVLDPPRAGLDAESGKLLAKVAAPLVVYVSCDPATLARDLRALVASGYAIESLTLADLFPQTFHLESIVRLRR